MNWKEINDTCPKAFLEWMRVYKRDKYIASAHAENFNFRLGYEIGADLTYTSISQMNEEVYKLPYYFDQYGIDIEVYSAYGMRRATVTDNEGTHILIDEENPARYFPDRLSATIAGGC